MEAEHLNLADRVLQIDGRGECARVPAEAVADPLEVGEQLARRGVAELLPLRGRAQALMHQAEDAP